MKSITLKELIELSKVNPNYTFSFTPDAEDKAFGEYKPTNTDIVGDLIHFCGGEIDYCLKCHINFFDSNELYLNTYCIQPTETEMTELQEDCDGWHLINML